MECNHHKKLRGLLAASILGTALITVPQIARAAVEESISGSHSVTQSFNQDDLTVTVEPNAVINVGIDNGIAMTGGGDQILVAKQGSSITGTNGIKVTNGDVTNITVNGNITATGTEQDVSGMAIYVLNQGSDLSLTVGDTAEIIGNTEAIRAHNYGAGMLDVSVSGNVTTAGTGVYLENYGTDLTFRENNPDATIHGDSYGMRLYNSGSGDTDVHIGGNVTSLSNSGIYVQNDEDTGNLTVSVGNEDAKVSGGGSGIYVQNDGSGQTAITNSGVVEGNDVGVRATTSNIKSFTLTINSTGEVRNTSQAMTDRAIEFKFQRENKDGASTIQNDGVITGTFLSHNYTGADNSVGDNVDYSVYAASLSDDTLNNVNLWNTAGGTNDFGNGYDVLNNSGTIDAANPLAIAHTRFDNLERVNFTGQLTMQNNLVGDTTTFSNNAPYFGTGTFAVNGGTVYLDTDFGPGISDVLVTDNVIRISTPTTLNINRVGLLANPTNGDGIEVVHVVNSSDPSAFVLNAPLSAGLYSYALNRGQVDTQSFFLQSQVRDESIVTNNLPVLGSRTALATLSNLHERERDVKVLSENQMSKGVWGRIFGQANKFESNDEAGSGFDTNLWGAQAGIDLMAKTNENGARKYAGLYVAYASSSGDALRGNDKIGSLDLDATTIGAYYTKYSEKGWYLDLVGQYSWLNGIKAKTATDNISPSGSSYALSLEAGRQYKPESKIIREVQAQLIYQNTDIDDVNLSDDTRLSISGLHAMTGRLGIRLYRNPKDGQKFLPWLRANIWHTFDSDSKISSQGNTFATPIGGTTGELQVGATLAGNESKWSLNAAAGYQWSLSGAEYSGWKGTLGVRRGW